MEGAVLYSHLRTFFSIYLKENVVCTVYVTISMIYKNTYNTYMFSLLGYLDNTFFI